MKNTPYILLTLLIVSVSARTQSVFTPSPNSAAIVRHINTPVNSYTGVPGISVALYTLPGRSSSLPVNLTYHASGIRVDDTPSDAGAGWSLNAGGAITRVVRDLPDESVYGFYNAPETGDLINNASFISNFGGTNATTYWDDYKDFADSVRWDTEPDIFYFSYPGGSGKFYLDAAGNPLLVPFQDLKIEKTTSTNSIDKWVITDKGGTRYTFGENIGSREYTASTITQREYSPPFARFNPTDLIAPAYDPSSLNEIYISSWHLDKIEDHNGINQFSFTYSSRPALDYNTISEHIENEVVEPGDIPSTVTIRETFISSLYTPKVVGTVTSAIGTIHFGYTLEGRLETMKVRSLPASSLTADFEFIYDTQGNEQNLATYRSFLTKIIQKPVGIVSGENIVYRRFEYDPRVLPYRGHPAVDHWGYSNGYIGANTRIASYVIDGQEYGNADSDKSPSITDTRAGSLDKIILPTGGTQTLLYELNETNEGPRGGLRIKSITSYDGLDVANNVVTNYSYTDASGLSSGRGGNIPIYNSSSNQDKTIVVSGQSINSLTDQGVGYQVVTTTNGAGKTVTQFQGFDNHPDQDLTFKVVKDQTTVTGLNKTISNLYDLVPKTSKSWERGRLKSRSVYDGDDNLLSYRSNTYTTIDVGNSTLYGLAARKSKNGGDTYYDMVMYEINSVGYVLDKSESISFDQKSPGISISSTTEYAYDQNNLNVKEVKTTDSEGEIRMSKTSYLQEYVITTVTDPALNAMKVLQDRNVDIPIEQVQYLQKPSLSPWVLGASVSTFKEFTTDRVYPDQVFAIELSSPIASFTPSRVYNDTFDTDIYYGEDAITTINSYDVYGNVLSSTSNSGIETAYTWDLVLNSLPLTVTTNPGITDIEKTTTYKYKTLVGVEEVTDTNGRVMTYRYDEFNRLILVLDHEGPVSNPGKILNKYEYKVVNVE